MLTLDSSGLIALLVRRDPDHAPALAVLEADPGPYLVPAGILGEAAYMIERRGGAHALDVFLADLQEGAFTLDCGQEDLARIRALVARYASLPLGFADAAVIACAERCGGRILTFDRRDFVVVAGEGTITIL
ncbi:MAG: type II toxin-antitoxin system VapC family toxin [Egibacteraceae bacterium]